ncbi:oxidoreductase protein [Cordyceps javanica]|uniref:Oxidoreductase protein n=1 Tax=Cordyceps javanica TaxID=43265 RepID=A0A545UR53_9HYPO|nr:oxidoreductase protein [Cordyceps javanica]TQW03887.1 FAD binding domain-containing protein [Cordyceps javanica]
MAGLRILISGAGIAGPAFAFWATRLGHTCTIVERSSELRHSGQQIDIRSHGIEVAKHMGILDDIRSLAVQESGVRFVDSQGAEQAFFAGTESSAPAQGLSSEFEIMRGDLSRLLNSKNASSVKMLLGTTVQSIRSHADSATVTFSDGSVGEYDLVVAADGQNSKIRQQLLRENPAITDESRNLGVYSAYYRIPRKATDSGCATVYVAPKERILCTRWHSADQGQAYLATMAHQDEMEEALKQGADTQKTLFENVFKDAGWESRRLIDGLRAADDFYAQSAVQVKISAWSKGRVVLLGDAAYCPTPLTGMGTSLALIGAYVLAGELSTGVDVPSSLTAYEKTLRPFVEDSQQLPLGLPSLAYPSSELGVKAFYWFAGLVSKLSLDKIDVTPSFLKSKPWVLPQYENLALSGLKST